MSTLKKFHGNTVRIFISSTFRDMQEERDQLAKFIFPKLRHLCRQRGVEMIEMDLRWGVTEEQAERGEVLSICFSGIEKCDIFISLLGERYGYIPDVISDELLEKYPWLNDFRDRSITELEIMHGALRRANNENNALFYFRDPIYIETLDSDIVKDFLVENKIEKTKLKSLKDKIRHSGYYLHKDYAAPKSLRKLIVKDVWQIISDLFPKKYEFDPLYLDRVNHEAFALSRTKCFVGRKDDLNKLSNALEIAESGLAIVGGPGVGKSALLANWGLRYRKEHPDVFVFFHFVASSTRTAEHLRLIARIFSEIGNHIGNNAEAPEAQEKLLRELPELLATTAASGHKIILIIDGIDQIENRDNALDIGWLPDSPTPNVRILVSTQPGRTLEAIKERGWKTIEVGLFNHTEREDFITEYLKNYGKRLSNDRVEEIAQVQQSGNPLFLRTLLEELRVCGVHDNLDSRIQYYLTGKTIEELFDKLLTRYENDYETEHKGLVRNTLKLLLGSRNGLSETELLDLLGTNGEKLAYRFWAEFFFAIEASFVTRSGLIGFSHDYLRNAAEKRYFQDQNARIKTHIYLGQYFKKKPFSDRYINELPWQLFNAGNKKSLGDLIADPVFIVGIVDKGDIYQVQRYLQFLEAEYDIFEKYKSNIKRFYEKADSDIDESRLMYASGKIFKALGRYPEAELFFGEWWKYLNDITKDEQMLIHASEELTKVFFEQGKLDQSEACLSAIAKHTKKLIEMRSPLAISPILKLSEIYIQKGFMEMADRLLESAQNICEYNSESIPFKLSEVILTRVELAISAHEFGASVTQRKLVSKPASLAEKAVKILRQQIGPYAIETLQAEMTLAKAFSIQGDHLNAIKKALWAHNRLKGSLLADHPDTAKFLITIGDVYWESGKREDSEKHYQKALLLLNEMEFAYVEKALVQNRLAMIARIKGKIKEAQKLKAEATEFLNSSKSFWGSAAPLHWKVRTSSATLVGIRRFHKIIEKFYQKSGLKFLDDKIHKSRSKAIWGLIAYSFIALLSACFLNFLPQVFFILAKFFLIISKNIGSSSFAENLIMKLCNFGGYFAMALVLIGVGAIFTEIIKNFIRPYFLALTISMLLSYGVFIKIYILCRDQFSTIPPQAGNFGIWVCGIVGILVIMLSAIDSFTIGLGSRKHFRPNGLFDKTTTK